MGGSAVTAAILAGGASRRMGEDKALLRIDPEGPTTIERVIAAARALSDDVVIICPGNRNYSQFGARIVADRYPGEGALGGIISALEASERRFTLVLSCDHPFLSVPLLRWMSEFPATQFVAPETSDGGRHMLHPIHARYRQDSLPILTAVFDSGERRLLAAVSHLETQKVGEGELIRFDPGMRSLWTVNTPEDANDARRLLMAKRGTDAESPMN